MQIYISDQMLLLYIRLQNAEIPLEEPGDK